MTVGISDHRYVLSAGRTGTVYLEKLINASSEQVRAEHEPGNSRQLMMLANFRNDFGFGDALLTRLFAQERARRERLLGPCYVEINPFLCAFTDVLPRVADSLKVVHIVRDPADWARSIHAFKASTRFRKLIDFVPFARPYPSPRPAVWEQLSGYDKALWRWNWCNEKIASIAGSCSSFCVIRYEDLFSHRTETRNRELSAITKTLDLPCELVANGGEVDRRENAFDAPDAIVDRAAARRICGNLAATYGYDY